MMNQRDIIYLQGLVLGPLLYNMMNNIVFKLTFPFSAQAVDIADDIAILDVAKYLPGTFLANESIRVIREWFTLTNLNSADDKRKL